MTKIRHLNCGVLHAPPNPKAICHCLLLEDKNGLVLIDTGIGLLDVMDPLTRVGTEIINLAGFQFHEELTAIRQIESLGYKARDVRHIILTHCDNDHTGGLGDFPQAKVHVSAEEYEAFQKGSYRYLTQQFEHHPQIQTYANSDEKWLGLEARKVMLPFETTVYLVPLFGHTLGHCGVAIREGERWIFYVGDAYYLRAELFDENHPVKELAALRAEDNSQRLKSLDKIRELLSKHAGTVEVFGYHDFSEFPENKTTPL